MRLVLIPAAVIAFSAWLGYKGLEIGVIISIFSTPVAISSYVMAHEMDCADELAGQIVVLTSILSMVTIFLSIYSSKLLGLL